jgi:uncharacterized peroxidase-related enzyme
MKRLATIDPNTATGRTKELLDRVHSTLGVTPNMMRTMAQSPAVLAGYLGLAHALASGRLSPRLREQLALTVAEANACVYCLSAHTAIGRQLGLSADELAAGRSAASPEPKVDAALKFARDLVERRGEVTDGDVRRLRAAGYADGEIAEIIANVALNVFTNYFNKAAGVEVDFPVVSPVAEAAEQVR